MINLLWKQLLIKIVGFVTKEAGEIIDFLNAENKIDGHIKLKDYDRILLVKYGLPIKYQKSSFCWVHASSELCLGITAL
jgi:hypothetical protein